jgi:actin-related protein
MQKVLYNLILEDIKNGKNGNKLDEKNLEILKKNIIQYMDDFMVRISYILNKKLSNEYKQITSNEESNETNEKESYSKIGFYPNVPLIKIDFNTRIFIGEKLFEENNKNNLAYLILKTLAENVPCEIRKKIGSNIILSGGLTMLEGFYQRFSDEINYISENNNQFKKLKGIKNDLRINKIIYPRNILTWVGASLFLSFNKVNFPGNEINRENKKIDDDELYRIFENLRI